MLLSYVAVLTFHALARPTPAEVWTQAKKEGFSGGVIIVSGDKTVLMDISNVSKLPSVQLKPNSLLPICSITKAMTAQVVLDIVASGKLSLDDSVSKHLTWVPSFAGKVTIRQLLTHTSGLANMNLAMASDPDGISKIYRTGDVALQPIQARILKILGENPVTEPGTNYDYSNTDFLLLEAIIESVTGKALDKELRSRIFTPAGFKSTRFPSWNEAPGKFVDCYESEAGKDKVLKPCNHAVYGAGGALLGTQEDLARWMKFTLKSKVGQRWLASGSQFGGFQGFGCYTTNLTDAETTAVIRPVTERPGAINGYGVQVSFLPQQNLGVAAFSNRADQNLGSAWEGKGLVYNMLQAALSDQKKGSK